MSVLELRYRRLVGWYPRSWRAAHEDAFVGTLLDVADADGRQSPTRQERTSIMSHGIAARLDRIIVPGIRNAGSTVTLTAGTGIALTEFVFSSWAPWGSNPGGSGWWPTRLGPFYDTGFLFAALWILALIAALTGRWAVGRTALLTSIVAALVTPQLFSTAQGLESVDRSTLALLSSCAVIAVLGRPLRGLPVVSATVGWSLMAALLYATAPSVPGSWLPSTTPWGQVGTVWYAATVVICVAVGLAIARFWNAAFTVILGFTPLAATFVINEIRRDFIENGTSVAVAVPVGIGLLLLFLHSSGQLHLTNRTTSGTRTPTLPSGSS